MKISVMGLGYVGCVSAACLAHDGNDVVGVDVNALKANLINEGRTPIIEDAIGDLIADAVGSGKLRATTEPEAAVAATDVSIVCVGTPSKPNGSLDLAYVERVCAQIGDAIRGAKSRHIVVIRSTVLPGTMRGTVIPILESHSGRTAGEGFGLCFNPEFLREGTSVDDYYHPPKVVIGSILPEDAETVLGIYAGIEAPVVKTSLEVAEMVKYVDNSFHALKVTFANEIGNICKELSIDSHRVMEIFCMDRKLNLSSYYFKPGFAFGGSCLPKDVRALSYKAGDLDLKTPVLGAILDSNEYQLKRGLDLILGEGKRRIGILGLSFKAGTDDLRESPMVALIETLIGKGYKLKIYDAKVNIAKLVGANKEYIEQRIEHISSLMTDTLEDLVSFAEVIVIGNKSREFAELLPRLGAHQIVVDLVRIESDIRTSARYKGLCW